MAVRLPELLVPAGNLSKLNTALAYGADAVYAGASGLSMRPDSASLSIDELAEAVDRVHAAGRRLYVAVNSLLFEDSLAVLETWLEETAGLAFDALIVSDPGAFGLARRLRPGLDLHISTQLSTANRGAAAFWKEAGAARVVLARECSLDQAAAIAGSAGPDVEIFVHGAMCVAYSGRCLLSAHLCGQSGSTGDCKHACRWEWQLVEEKRPGESLSVFESGRETIFLGSKDLCLIEHMPALVQSGVRALKVEGRMKSEYHVANITRVYRDALDRYAGDPDTFQTDARWMEELEAVSHRPYGPGFAFGYPDPKQETLQTGNRPVSSCDLAALVLGVEQGVCDIEAKSVIRAGDALEWIGPDMQGGTLTVLRVLDADHAPAEKSIPGRRSFLTFKEAFERCPNAILRRRLKRPSEEDAPGPSGGAAHAGDTER